VEHTYKTRFSTVIRESVFEADVEDVIFQQDGDSKHRSGKAKTWFVSPTTLPLYQRWSQIQSLRKGTVAAVSTEVLILGSLYLKSTCHRLGSWARTWGSAL
jgi:hypothetical protein